MKKIPCLICLCMLFSAISISQEFRINAYSGYVFDDQVDSYYSTSSYFDGKILGGFRWGAGIEYMLAETYGLELSYWQQNSTAPIRYYDNVEKNTEFDYTGSFIMIGGYRYMKKDNFEPYAGMKIGMAILKLDNPENGNSNSATKFAWGIHLGTNIFLSPQIGIKIQADLMSAVQGMGGGLYLGTGGAGVGASTYSSLLQFGLGGGLVYRIKKK